MYGEMVLFSSAENLNLCEISLHILNFQLQLGIAEFYSTRARGRFSTDENRPGVPEGIRILLPY